MTFLMKRHPLSRLQAGDVVARRADPPSPRPRSRYRDKDSFTIWAAFRVAGEADGAAAAPPERLQGARVVVWTTTPWTIPSNRAVVFGEKIAYGLYEVTGVPDECWAKPGDRYVLADRMAAEVLSKARLEEGQWSRIGGRHARRACRLLPASTRCTGLRARMARWDEVR